MNGFTVFLRKEFREIARTWRIWVLPSVVVLFAVTGPLVGRYSRELLSGLAGDQAGALIPAAGPQYTDAYLQWAKNLSQLVALVLILMAATSINSEKTSGTALLVLTKPLSRASFVLAKVVALGTLVAASVLAGAVLTWAGTRLLFGRAPVADLAAATGCWLLLALLLICLGVAWSALVDAGTGAAGIAVACYLALALAGMWRPLARFSPSGLIAAVDPLVRGQHTALAWPALTSALAAGLLTWLAVAVLRRREL